MNHLFIDESGIRKNSGFFSVAGVAITDRLVENLPITLFLYLCSNPISHEQLISLAASSFQLEGSVKKIFIDGKKLNKYERRLKSALRQKGLSTQKLLFQRAKHIPGLRIADAAAGRKAQSAEGLSTFPHGNLSPATR